MEMVRFHCSLHWARYDLLLKQFHFRLQEQEAFVPPGQQKEYPWIEVAKHVKNHEKQKEESN